MSNAKKAIRIDFKNACFQRDGNACRVCGAPPADAHHVTDRTLMPNGGYVAENGISLCSACHEKAEEWHRSGHQRFEPGFHPDDLYKLIGSSYEQAVEASGKLGEKK